MGRYIQGINNEFYYKYSFAEEDSNLSNLYEAYNIGVHTLDENNLEYKIKRSELKDLKELKEELESKYGLDFDKAYKEKWGNGNESCNFVTIKEVNKKYSILQEHWTLNLVRKLVDYIESDKSKTRVFHFSDEW